MGIDLLIDTEWRKPQEYEQIANIAKKHDRQVKDMIGLSVKKLSPAQIYTELVRQLGLKTESIQKKQLTVEQMIQNSTTKPQNSINQNTTECPLDSDPESEVFNTPEAIASGVQICLLNLISLVSLLNMSTNENIDF